MKTYRVEIEVTYSYHTEVEAESPEAAQAYIEKLGSEQIERDLVDDAVEMDIVEVSEITSES